MCWRTARPAASRFAGPKPIRDQLADRVTFDRRAVAAAAQDLDIAAAELRGFEDRLAAAAARRADRSVAARRRRRRSARPCRGRTCAARRSARSARRRCRGGSRRSPCSRRSRPRRRRTRSRSRRGIRIRRIGLRRGCARSCDKSSSVMLLSLCAAEVAPAILSESDRHEMSRCAVRLIAALLLALRCRDSAAGAGRRSPRRRADRSPDPRDQRFPRQSRAAQDSHRGAGQTAPRSRVPAGGAAHLASAAKRCATAIPTRSPSRPAT